MSRFRFDRERGWWGLRHLVTGRCELGLAVLAAGLLFVGVAGQAWGIAARGSSASCKNPTAQPLDPGPVTSSFSGVAATYGCRAWAVGTTREAPSNSHRVLERQEMGSPAEHEFRSTSRGGHDLSDQSLGGRLLQQRRYEQTLVERWNGKAWKVQPSSNPGGSSNLSQLSGVAATSSRNAWAVGYYFNGSALQTLIEHWNGKAWKTQPSPNPSVYGDILDGVPQHPPPTRGPSVPITPALREGG